MSKLLCILILLAFSNNVISEEHLVNIKPKILSVSSAGKVKLSLQNLTQATIWVHKQAICSKEGLSFTNIFDVEEKNGNPILYSWIEAEINNYNSKVNFIELGADGIIESSCDLKELFLLVDNVTYKVRYNAFNPRLEQSQKGFEMKSEYVGFTFKKSK